MEHSSKEIIRFMKCAEDALEHASRIARRNFGKVSGRLKFDDPSQVLTDTDLRIGEYLVETMQKRFPDHNIIDEETGVINRGSQYTWVIDPVDGTSNFAASVPMYGIIIGLLYGGSPIVGGVSLPQSREIFTAGRNHGAFRNRRRISLTDRAPSVENHLFAYGIDGNRKSPSITYFEGKIIAEIALRVRNIRASNSVFDAMMVIKGSYGAYMNLTSKVWDNVGVHAVMEEAGGLYTDAMGHPIDYGEVLEHPQKNYHFLMAPPALHKSYLQILVPLLPELNPLLQLKSI